MAGEGFYSFIYENVGGNAAMALSFYEKVTEANIPGVYAQHTPGNGFTDLILRNDASHVYRATFQYEAMRTLYLKSVDRSTNLATVLVNGLNMPYICSFAVLDFTTFYFIKSLNKLNIVYGGVTEDTITGKKYWFGGNLINYWDDVDAGYTSTPNDAGYTAINDDGSAFLKPKKLIDPATNLILKDVNLAVYDAPTAFSSPNSYLTLSDGKKAVFKDTVLLM